MAIDFKIYDTDDLLQVQSDANFKENIDLSMFWTKRFFKRVHMSTSKYIDFDKMGSIRDIAPYVVQTALGRPIGEKGSKMTRVEPAYIKLLNAIDPSRSVVRRPGELSNPAKLSPQQRMDDIQVDILAEHINSINRTKELQAANAVINGKIVVKGEDYPERTIDYERDPSHTIALVGAARWGQIGVSIIDNINTWRAQTRNNPNYGGPTNSLIVGGDAWEKMRKDDEIKAELDTTYRGTSADLNMGVRDGSGVEFMGKLGGSLDVIVYSEKYKDPTTGTLVDILDPKSIVLAGDGLDGVAAYGVIPEQSAGYQAWESFSRTYLSQNPEVAHMLTQSAPLMIAVNPNTTLKAKVLV
jgi:hypothetical protein